MITFVGPGTSLAELVRQAHRDGEDVVVVPSGGTKAETLEWFADALHFPSWFGKNLDALADCLHDWAELRPAGDAEARHLVWDGVAALRVADSQSYQGICGVLDEVQEDHPMLVVTVVDR